MARETDWLDRAILLAAGTVVGIGVYKCFVKPWLDGKAVRSLVPNMDAPPKPVQIPVQVVPPPPPQALPQAAPQALPAAQQTRQLPQTAGFRSVDGMIGLMDRWFDQVNTPPGVMPAFPELARIFTGRGITTLTPQYLNYYRVLLYTTRSVMDREGYTHDRPGRYDLGDNDRLVLARGPDGVLRIDLDQSSR